MQKSIIYVRRIKLHNLQKMHATGDDHSKRMKLVSDKYHVISLVYSSSIPCRYIDCVSTSDTKIEVESSRAKGTNGNVREENMEGDRRGKGYNVCCIQM